VNKIIIYIFNPILSIENVHLYFEEFSTVTEQININCYSKNNEINYR